MINSPYFHRINVYKGQLHCHTRNSDGLVYSDKAMRLYSLAGYHFMAITDHDYLTLNPATSQVEFIKGCEQTGTPFHILNVGANNTFNNSDPQAVINSINSDGGFASIAHPHLMGITKSQMETITGYTAMEIRNGIVERALPALDKWYDERLWDELLTDGIHVWAIVVDDCHDYNNAEFNKYSIMVFADSLDGVYDAIRQGNFYALENGGSLITRIDIGEEYLKITVGNPSKFEFIGAGGAILKEVNGVTEALYKITGEEGYVRARITNSTSGKCTWTQPVYTDLQTVIPGYKTRSLTENGRMVINTHEETGIVVP